MHAPAIDAPYTALIMGLHCVNSTIVQTTQKVGERAIRLNEATRNNVIWLREM